MGRWAGAGHPPRLGAEPAPGRNSPAAAPYLERMDRTLALPTLATPCLVTLLALAAAAPLDAQRPAPPAIDGEDQREIIEEIAAALDETYIFAETAAAMGARLGERLASGAYDGAGDLAAFADRLTEDLQGVSHDKHLRVRWEPPRPLEAGEGPSEEERRARFAENLRRDNYCFRRVEHLQGNVGYLKLDCFAPAELAGATAVAAMNFLAGSDALIVDLRDNGGGSPSMIQLLTSYLLEEPTHLNSFYIRRSDETRQFWTQAHVVGLKLIDIPVWVLTSGQTFSAAEEFTYNLKNLERATLVGETTGGGAHPVELYTLKDHDLSVSLPFGRAINPISGTNWEGTGVTPHRETPAPEALSVAHQDALGRLAETAEDPERRAQLAFARETLELRGRAPVALDEATLEAYVGVYGPRKITREGSRLLYQREDGPVRELIPAGDDRFLLDGADDFRVRFERASDGRVIRIVGLYDDGSEEPNDRG